MVGASGRRDAIRRLLPVLEVSECCLVDGSQIASYYEGREEGRSMNGNLLPVFSTVKKRRHNYWGKEVKAVFTFLHVFCPLNTRPI